MNQFMATVTKIEHIENLHLVSLEVGNQSIKMISLELNELLELDKVVKLNLKSTNIAIAKNFTGMISYANQLSAKVTEVNNGILLSSIQLLVEGFTLESLITLESSLELELCVDDEVVVLIKESEISVCG
ncbi:MAG: TOBE domain-containing protein [Sulfurovaceae bacterium]|nr:TOBE domain-containing protein [Sulfurovaceae bacterium]